MRFLALASDYDGTLAEHGQVSPETLRALSRLRESGGRRLVLVTGRRLDDLRTVFPEYALCDRIVAENGALLFNPESREERLLATPPPAALLSALEARGVPFDTGHVIVASDEAHAHAILSEIQALGLELQLIFNKGAVMVLPTGVSKATGLAEALADLGLSAHNTVGVGDAENDHALLEASEFGVAVFGSLPMLKEHADWVTDGGAGAGVVELIDGLIQDDLRARAEKISRHDLLLGEPITPQDEPPVLAPYGPRVLICGTSGSGKSTLATGFLEQLEERGYQYCLVDPEGDFDGLPGAVVLGDEQEPATPDQLVQLLRNDPDSSAVANLLALPLDRRPERFLLLLAELSRLRVAVGRPHWIVIDEAHHMLPEGGAPELPEPVAHPPSGLLLITVHPERLSRAILPQIDTVIALGEQPLEALRCFARLVSVPEPSRVDDDLSPGEALFFRPSEPARVVRFRARAPRSERHRHRRKYAAGALGEDKSFYFRGPQEALNLRAQNLVMFLQIADGVDDPTFLHHLHQNDYSRWIEEAIKNDDLARDVLALEEQPSEEPREVRKHLRELIERVYTLPA